MKHIESVEEFNEIIIDYELDKRTILIYGNIDEKFMKNYLKRKNIIGFDRLKFYNFKHDIISSSFSFNLSPFINFSIFEFIFSDNKTIPNVPNKR